MLNPSLVEVNSKPSLIIFLSSNVEIKVWSEELFGGVKGVVLVGEVLFSPSGLCEWKLDLLMREKSEARYSLLFVKTGFSVFGDKLNEKG